jgi:hypothetical protein
MQKQRDKKLEAELGVAGLPQNTAPYPAEERSLGLGNPPCDPPEPYTGEPEDGSLELPTIDICVAEARRYAYRLKVKIREIQHADIRADMTHLVDAAYALFDQIDVHIQRHKSKLNAQPAQASRDVCATCKQPVARDAEGRWQHVNKSIAYPPPFRHVPRYDTVGHVQEMPRDTKG